jgi:hypothetical protein
MTAQTYFVQPPRIATWLLNLFTPVGEAESILGDLLEEYYHLASNRELRSPDTGIGDRLRKLSRISPPGDSVSLRGRALSP